MTDKIIAMPTDDEIFAAFKHGLDVGTPESKKGILSTFDKFVDKAKTHLKKMIALTDAGLAFNLTEQTGNELLSGFISEQGFLTKPLLKGALMMFNADTFTSFINSVKTGKNNRENTVGGLTKIMAAMFQSLGEKYAVTDTEETIAAKMNALFDAAPAA